MRSGNIETMRQMLENDPFLAQERNPLFVAAVHPNVPKAIEMIDLLMEKGTVLGSRDVQKRHALLYACHKGVEWEIIESLLKWNTAKGGKILKWSRWDENFSSSLVLASERGHTWLTLRLLDEFDVEELARQNHPFQVLEAAISTDDEMHAMTIAEHPKVEAGLRAHEIYRYKEHSGFTLWHTISTCTEAAIWRGMSDVVLHMDALNHRKVSKAVWYCIQELVKEAGEDAVHPVILRVAGTFVRDWRWAQVKGPFLLRYRGCDSDMASSELQSHLLVQIPDGISPSVIEFVKPKTFRGWRESNYFSSVNALIPCLETVSGTNTGRKTTTRSFEDDTVERNKGLKLKYEVTR